MAQSDQSKKSWFFQSRDSSPIVSSLWRSLVRFSNHTASTSSNTTVFIPVVWDTLLMKMGNRPLAKDTFYDAATRAEALENVTGTLIQNILFQPLKIKTMVPLLAYVILALGDDDRDEATVKAQELADNWLVADEDSNPIAAFLKMFLLGRQRQLFQERKDPEAARASAMAELTSKAMIETMPMIPLVGVLAGYSPVSGVLTKKVTNGLAEELVSTGTGVEVGFWAEKDKMNIREYDADWHEAISDITAPTAVLQDWGAAVKLGIDAGATGDVSPLELAMYALGEIISPLREFRSKMQGDLQKAVKEAKD